MGTQIWSLLQKFILLFSGLWTWLNTPIDLSGFRLLELFLNETLNISELTPLGLFTTSTITIIIIYKLIRLFI